MEIPENTAALIVVVEEKRLSYEISNAAWTTETMLANHHQLVGRGYLDMETVIALDLTDVSKPSRQWRDTNT